MTAEFSARPGFLATKTARSPVRLLPPDTGNPIDIEYLELWRVSSVLSNRTRQVTSTEICQWLYRKGDIIVQASHLSNG